LIFVDAAWCAKRQGALLQQLAARMSVSIVIKYYCSWCCIDYATSETEQVRATISLLYAIYANAYNLLLSHTNINYK